MLANIVLRAWILSNHAQAKNTRTCFHHSVSSENEVASKGGMTQMLLSADYFLHVSKFGAGPCNISFGTCTTDRVTEKKEGFFGLNFPS